MRHYNQRYTFVVSQALDAASAVGPAPVVLGLMAALAKKGKKVALATPPATLRLPVPLVAAWFNRRVAGVLAGLETDVVIGFDGDGHRFARSPRRGRPFVCFLTGDLASRRPSAWPGRGGLAARRLRAAVCAADLVVANSRHVHAQAIDEYGVAADRVSVLPPGIDAEEWPARALPEHDRPRVFALASGATGVDFAWLLEGCVQARRHGLPLQLQVSAATQPRAFVAQAMRAGLTTGDITIDARRRCADVKAELGACDLFVQLSQGSQGVPHVLWAMATGRPVIIPGTGVFPEITADAATQVPPGDGHALGGAIKELLGSRAAAQMRARNGIERATAFTWERIARIFGERLAEI